MTAMKLMNQVPNPASPSRVRDLTNAMSWVTGAVGFALGLGSSVVLNPVQRVGDALKLPELAEKFKIDPKIIKVGIEAIFIIGIAGLGLAISYSKLRPIGTGLVGYAVGLAVMWIINTLLTL